MKEIVKVDSLTKTRGNSQNQFTLGPITLEVRAGEIIALTGLNGAGKTTLIKLVMGLLKPDTGKIKFAKGLSRIEIGYMPETFAGADNNMKAIDWLNLMAGLNGLKKREKKAAVEKVLILTNMIDNCGKKFSEMSKGMKTRIGLAQALLKSPPLLILDEPADGLDPRGRDEIRKLLLKLKKLGNTILLSTHILREAELLCDRVIILDKGKLVLDEKLNELYAGSMADTNNNRLEKNQNLEEIFLEHISGAEK